MPTPYWASFEKFVFMLATPHSCMPLSNRCP